MVNYWYSNVTRKCDNKLGFWLNLANLYTPLPQSDWSAEGLEGDAYVLRMRDQFARSAEERSANPRLDQVPAGFAKKVRELLPSDYKPEGLEVFLDTHSKHMMKMDGGSRRPPIICLGACAKRAKDPQSPPYFSGLIFFVRCSSPLLRRRDSSAIVRVDPVEPLRRLLDGRPVNSIGKCLVCDRLFERLKERSKCDVRRCRDTWRKRQSRRQNVSSIGEPTDD